MAWGRHVENRLNELDADRRPKYSLHTLLDIEDKRSIRTINRAGIDALKALATMPGAVRIVRVANAPTKADG